MMPDPAMLSDAASRLGGTVSSGHPGLTVRQVRRGPDVWVLAVSGELSLMAYAHAESKVATRRGRFGQIG
jgi:hypothetical protein